MYGIFGFGMCCLVQGLPTCVHIKDLDSLVFHTNTQLCTLPRANVNELIEIEIKLIQRRLPFHHSHLLMR